MKFKDIESSPVILQLRKKAPRLKYFGQSVADNLQ